MRHALWFVALLVLLPLASTAHTAEPERKKIVFLAGGPSHGLGAHDHLAGCTLLANKLEQAMPGYETLVVQGWPADAKPLEGAHAVILYCDGGDAHMALPHAQQLDALCEKGVGIGCIHYAVEVPTDGGGPMWLKWIGGYFQQHFSINPHWLARFESLPDHPVARGVAPFSSTDEWYYNMRFRHGMTGVTPILSAVPPDDTRRGPDGPHSGNPHVRAGIGRDQPEHVLWVAENNNGSRGFGTTGGHVHWNWANDNWRKTVLNAIVWIAGAEVPRNGVNTKTPTVEEMLANHDEQIPKDFDREALARRIAEMNR